MNIAGMEQPKTSEFTLEEYFAGDIETNLHLFSMHLRRVKGNWFYPSHEHFQYEINYLVEGHQVFTTNGKTFSQHAGDLMLIHPGDVHFSRSGDGEEFIYFCLHFQINDIDLLSVLNRSKETFYAADSSMVHRVRAHLDRMIDYSKRWPSLGVHDRMRMHAELFQLFASLAEELLGGEEAAQLKRTKPAELAMKISHRIEEMLKLPHIHQSDDDDRFGIDDIAAEFGISVSYCTRIFKEHFEMSPRQYLSSMMLQKAKHLLLQKELTIDHVAELLGYRNIAHFSRQYKRWTGESPGCFRNKNA